MLSKRLWFEAFLIFTDSFRASEWALKFVGYSLILDDRAVKVFCGKGGGIQYGHDAKNRSIPPLQFARNIPMCTLSFFHLKFVDKKSPCLC